MLSAPGTQRQQLAQSLYKIFKFLCGKKIPYMVLPEKNSNLGQKYLPNGFQKKTKSRIKNLIHRTKEKIQRNMNEDMNRYVKEDRYRWLINIWKGISINL